VPKHSTMTSKTYLSSLTMPEPCREYWDISSSDFYFWSTLKKSAWNSFPKS